MEPVLECLHLLIYLILSLQLACKAKGTDLALQNLGVAVGINSEVASNLLI